MQPLDFSRAPFIVIWEVTRACDLACAHCRAEAQPQALPGELSRAEALALIDDVAGMGARVLVFTGGDPLKREDLPALIRHGKSRGLRVGTIPAAAPGLTREKVQELKEAGLDQMALSLDASAAPEHDRFRGVEGTYAKVMEAAGWAREAGIPLQINSVVTRGNLEDMPRLAQKVAELGAVFWEVFFLVPMGRGRQLEELTGEEVERVFALLWETAQGARFTVKVTEAPHFRRYGVEQRCRREGLDPRALVRGKDSLPPGVFRTESRRGSIGVLAQTVNAGKGYAFISYDGEVFPSGFLPESAGNVRRVPFPALYRDAPLFRSLRDPAMLRGKCGICDYRGICGGSRSRAYALTGDFLAEEPWCAHVPSGGVTPAVAAAGA